MNKGTLVVLLTLVLVAVNAYGYEAMEVKDGGSLKGRVKMSGNIPKDEVIAVDKDADHCGAKLPREKYVLSADGGVQYAVVFIKGIAKGKAVSKNDVLIDNKHCSFHPHAQVGTIGQSMIVRNDDPMLHNTHMYLNKRTIFNAALPRTGMEIKKPINREGLVEIHCDAHTFMLGWLYVLDHPYGTTTDANGNFSISNIPAGTYDVEIWHEALGVQNRSITISANGTVELNVEYKQ